MSIGKEEWRREETEQGPHVGEWPDDALVKWTRQLQRRGEGRRLEGNRRRGK
jgi:hypothetical protein